jgi:hypothetical protein
VLVQRSDISLLTVACAHVVPTRTGARMRLTSAGHPLPVLRAARHAPATVGPPGLLLGMTGAARWEESEIELAPGDTLLFYTDGVTDTPSGRTLRRGAPARGAPGRTGRPREMIAAVQGACASSRSATWSTTARCSRLQLVGVAGQRRARPPRPNGVGALSHGAAAPPEDIERLELRTQATPAAVPGVRRAVVDFAELHGRRHRARRGARPSARRSPTPSCTPTATAAGPVRVVACAEPDRLVVVVRDYGCG